MSSRNRSLLLVLFFFFKQKTAYEMRISDWSSDVCSSDLPIATALTYSYLGNPAAVDPSQVRSAGMTTQADVRAMVASLQARLAQHPDHPGGWQIGRASCRERVCQYV